MVTNRPPGKVSSFWQARNIRNRRATPTAQGTSTPVDEEKDLGGIDKAFDELGYNLTVKIIFARQSPTLATLAGPPACMSRFILKMSIDSIAKSANIDNLAEEAEACISSRKGVKTLSAALCLIASVFVELISTYRIPQRGELHT